MKTVLISICTMSMFYLSSCTQPSDNGGDQETTSSGDFEYQTEQFADIKIMRYQVEGFDSLSLAEKEFAYYLSQAAYFGRDINYVQNYVHNLAIRRTLESIVEYYSGDRTAPEFEQFMVYTKRVWFSNGIHHHYSMDKIKPPFTPEYFAELVRSIPADKLPARPGESVEYLITELTFVMFDPETDAKRVSLEDGKDLVEASACNHYEGLTQKEVEDYYKKVIDTKDETPISYGLNSKLIKNNDQVEEKVYKIGGLYTEAIEKIVFWLEKAASVAQTDAQREVVQELIKFYQTGDLKTWDDYSIKWVDDVDPVVDFTNGFIEVYGDPLGYRGSWQSMVYIKDFEMTQKFGVLSGQAKWFEDHSPIMDAHKRPDPQGVSYKVINVLAESGDVSPSTPIGVNLPNANWIRAQHGSKSVSLGNIEHAYDMASQGSGMLEEFYTPEQVALIKEYATLAGKLHTGLHEVIGHGSGQIMPGVGTPKQTLKNYANTLEEARADLVALYYVYDPYLTELGLTPSLDVGKAEYNNYIVNGLMKQLVRIEPGAQIEESHMRNRALIARWCYEKGAADNVIEKKTIDQKTYFVVNDYDKLRDLFGELLREIQRIKSEGDYNAGRDLVENYGVTVDADLHNEVLARFKKLNQAPYGGFINPILVAVKNGDTIVDVKIEYPRDFTEQMMYYAKNYSTLPSYEE